MDITESILTSIKKLLGIDASYTHFDPDLVMHINSVFAVLTQMGVGPASGFAITDEDQEWKDFLAEILHAPEGQTSVRPSAEFCCHRGNQSADQRTGMAALCGGGPDGSSPRRGGTSKWRALN